MRARLLTLGLVALALSSPLTPRAARLTGMADGYYHTTFSGGTESPLSEGGVWTERGLAEGLDWTNPVISGALGIAYGTQGGSGGVDDSVAVLGGTWDADQDVTIVAHNTSNSSDGLNREIEILLRGSITAHSAQFYELNYTCRTDLTYAQLVRWNGAVNDFTLLAGTDSMPGGAIVDGDILRGTIVGTVITSYKWNTGTSSWDTLFSYDTSTGNDGNGGGPDSIQFSTGNPGIGFYTDGGPADSAHGITEYTAINYGDSPPAPAVALTGTSTASITESDIVSGGKTAVLTATNDTWVSDVPAITFVGEQSGSFAGTTTDQTVTFALTGGAAPTPAAGDFVIVSYAIGTAARTPTLAIKTTGGTDYTLLGSQLLSDDTFDTILRSAYRVMPGTPETQFTLSSNATGGSGNAADGATWTVHVFRNVDATTPLDGVTVTTATAINGHAANPPSITPSSPGAVTYHVGAAAMTTGAVFTSADLLGFESKRINDTNDSAIGAGYLTWSGSGANDPAAFSGGGGGTTADSWAALSVVLRPTVASDAFTAAKSAIRSGFDSAQSEGTGWDARLSSIISTSNIVRTSSTVATVTFSADASYNISAQETITITVPSTALVGGGAVVASPTFTIDPSGGGGTPCIPRLSTLGVSSCGLALFSVLRPLHTP